MSKITTDEWLNPVWHRILYSYTHMATVGVKGLGYTVKVTLVHAEKYKTEDKN